MHGKICNRCRRAINKRESDEFLTWTEFSGDKKILSSFDIDLCPSCLMKFALWARLDETIFERKK